jgi:ubiquitin-conjugating enzyme E2 variant
LRATLIILFRIYITGINLIPELIDTDLDTANPAGLKALQDLHEDGVEVAQGNGTPLQRFLVNAVLLVGLCAGTYQSLGDPVFLLVLPAVLILIDFLSGFVHWFFDTQVEPGNTPLGRIAIDFLDHHVRPLRTAEVGFYASAWRPAAYVSLPLMTIALFAPLSTVQSAAIFWIGWVSMLVPQTHKLAHIKQPSQFVQLLQKCRLIIHPSSHEAHHRDNNESFCVFTGWLNPALDRSRFWRGLEWVFAWSSSK